MLSIYYTNEGEERGIKEPWAGGSMFIQRFGSALDLNVHFHTIVVDGVYAVAGSTPINYQLPGPIDEEMAGIVEARAAAVISDLRRRNYVPEEGLGVEVPSWFDGVFRDSEQLQVAIGASATMHIAFGERAGKTVRRIDPGSAMKKNHRWPKGLAVIRQTNSRSMQIVSSVSKNEPSSKSC